MRDPRSFRRAVSALITLCVSLLGSLDFIGAEEGTRRAFLVAVGEYQSRDMPPLAHTNKNVQDVRNLLLKQKYSSANIWVINDDSGNEYARRSGIVNRFQQFLDTVEQNDEIFVLLSGHGMRFFADSPNPRQQRDDYFFCPRISNIRDPESMISIDKEFATPIASRGKRRILLVDACRAVPAQLPGAAPASVTRPLKASGTETMVIMSCGPQQYSYYDNKGSYFLQSVQRGLEGLADRASPTVDRVVTAEEFSAWVVAETSRLSNGRQYPEVNSTLTAPNSWFICQKAEKRLFKTGEMSSEFFTSPENVELQFAEFRGVDFTRFGEISGINFQKARFVDGCNLRSVKFVNCRFDHTVFMDCDLSLADFSESLQTHTISLGRGVRKFGVRWPINGKPVSGR